MYKQITLSCECGRQPFKVREIGLTPERQLVIYWRCSQCRRHVYIVKSLADYWRECPSVTPQLERKAAYGTEDALFLRRVGICLPDEDEPSR